MEAVGASEATIKSLLTKLGSLLAEEYALIRGVRGDIQFINDELASMQAFLSNLSNSGDDHDDQTKDWMKQVRDVSYDIEDCVDDFAHGIRPDPRGNGLWSIIRRTVYEIQTWSLRRRVAVQITDLKERAKNVGERRGRYGVRDPENGKKKSILAGSTGYLAAENQETTRRLVSVKKPVGVKDIEKLEKWISFEDNNSKLGVLSIVGFGGVGKTTIAMALYRKYGDQFQHRAVVTVSQNSDPEAILRNVLNQVKPQANSEELQAGYSAAAGTSLLGSIWSRIISPAGKQEEDEEKNEGLQEEPKSYLNNRNVLNQVKPQANSEELQAGYSAAAGTSLLGSIWSRIISPAGKQEEDEEKNEGLQEEPKSYLNNRNVLNQVKPQANSEELQAGYSAAAGTSLLENIWSRIISPAGKQEEDEEKNKGLQEELKSYLNNRYLLLIDDVWSSSTWESIKKYFPEKDNGSRIIVTTRFQAVATTCFAHQDNDHLHPVKVLSNDEARDLFQKSLLECKHTAESRQSWSKIPERVWGMCGGLPLAIVTMAGLVASNTLRTDNEWTAVCNSLFPEPEKCRKPEDFMRIINFCYNDLPGDLKTCTLYLSIFPKGRKISSKKLIRRWIAEGFVTEKQGLSVEDVAETCFNQLIERKIIRPVEHSSNGRVKSCQVHDMVLEYIISKAAEEDFTTVVGGYWSMTTRSNKVRRLSLHSTDYKHAKKADSMNLSHVRSLTVFGSLDQLHFKSFKTGILQVLDLEGCRGFKANHFSVTDICEMTLLKYLSLRGTNISKLPSKIGNLKYLETLDIRQTDIEELPKSIVQLERISNILGGDKRTRKTLKLPKDVKGTMKGLRILSGIEIVKGSTAALDLRDFTRLRKLAIYKLNKGDQNQMFEELRSSIVYLSGYSLQSLAIEDESSEFFEMLDSMTSHPVDLRTLELSGKLLKIPMWLPSLNELIKLTLSVTALRTNNLVLLSQLQSLFSLTFSISAANQDPDIPGILEENKADSGGEIFLPSKGFSKLKLLCIVVPLLPALNFSMNGTPLLEKVELRFKRFEGLRGIDKVESLHDVVITVDGKPDESTNKILKNLKESSSGKHLTLTVMADN